MRLRTRLAIFLLGLLLIPTCAMGVVALDYSVGTMIEDLCRSADLFAQQIFEQMRVDLATGAPKPESAIRQSASLRRLLDFTQAYGQGVVSASILAPDGKVIVSAQGEGEGTPAPSLRSITKLQQHGEQWLPWRAIEESWTANVYELRRSVLANGQPIATISVGVTTALIADRLRRVMGIIVVSAVTSILAAWLLLSVVSDRVFRHLSRILRGFEELAAGDAEIEIRAEGEIELDALTDKFNALSRRVRHERAELATRDHLFDIVRSMQDALLMVDGDGLILFANPRAQQIIAPSANKIEGEFLRSILREDHQLIELVESAIQVGTEARDLTLAFDDETTYLVSVFKLGRGRNPVGLLIMLRDLQPVIELETALDYSNRLARLGTLISGIAHQLRSPLHGMNLRLELLNNDGGEDKQRHILRLRQELERLDRSVEALLRFMRPEELKATAFDINQLVRELSGAAQNSSVSVDLQLDATIPMVYGDRAMLSEALGNIVTNALQAMPEGGLLTVRSLRSNGQYVELQIIDTGVGIEQEKLAQIFNLYFTTKPQGNGLGLSLALRGIELNHGQIEIESKVGVGTTCRVKLPIAVGEAPKEVSPDAA